MIDRQPSLEKNNVLAPVGYAVTEEDDLLGVVEDFEVLVGLGDNWLNSTHVLLAVGRIR